MRLVTRTPIRGRPNDADLGQAPVIDKDLTAPPGSPSLGDRYIVASVATGAWAGQEDDIAQWAGSAWAFTTPEIGVWLYVEDEKEYYSWNGTAWVQESAGPHASTHASGGTDELTSSMLLEAQIKRIQESSGPTSLLVGQIDDADYLARVGTDILGRSPIPQTGFENRTDTDAAAMNGANLEIAPKVSTFNVYSGGKKIVINSTLQWAISTDLKEHFCTIDSNGVAQVSTSRWSLVSDDVHVATVYKDGANYDVTDERHGARHNQLWHQEHHNTVGTTYKSGLTGSFLDASFSIAQGVIYDEDIDFDTGGAETDCTLWLRTPAVTPTTMTFTPAVAVPYLDTVGDGSGILQWDDDGTPTNAGANKYVANYVYARNSDPNAIAVVVGQAEFTTQAGAEMAALPSILLDVAEWRLLYRVVYRNVGGTATYISAQDFRRVTTGQAADATALSHAATTARDAANSHPADAITNTPAGNIAATEVQAAIDELDAEKAALVHASRHQNGGADEVSVAGLSGELADDQPPKDHASAHDSGGGDAMAIDAAAGTGSLRTLGTGATQAAGGTDARLSDARTPTAHKDSHKTSGGDAFLDTDTIEAVIKRIRTTTGPSNLNVDALIDGEYLKRDGSIINSAAPRDLNPALGSDHTAEGLTATDTVGENVAFGDLLYMKSDGKYWKADADAVATMPGTVMALATILADAAGALLHKGYARDDTWNWTIGGLLYASETAGGFVQVTPSDSGDQVQVVGYAVTADIMFFDPQLVMVEVV